MENEPQEYVAPRRQISSEQIWGTIIFLAVIGCGVWYLINNFRTQARENHAAEMRQQQKYASFAALVLKYNAVTNWASSLSSRGFSIDVSRALIQSNGQPVLIIMELKDVAENKGGCTALFGKDDLPSATYQLSVELKCTPEQAGQLLKTPDNIFPQKFAVVARCEEVIRPKFKVSFGGVSSSEDGVESSPIVLDDSSDVILVKGEFLDAVQLP